MRRRDCLVALVIQAALLGALAGDSPERDLEDQTLCEGYDEEYGESQTQCGVCHPVDCAFAAWGNWYPAGGCSGLVLRQRDVRVSNNECGRPCYGAKIESEKRLLPRCMQKKEDCVFSQWTQWSGCNDPQDQSMRTRHIENDGTILGHGCFGSTRETRACSHPEPRACVFAPWQVWTPCSSTCGEGRRTRLRHVESKAANGGEPCNDVLLEVWKCRERDCPRVDCEVRPWSEWSECGKELQRFRSRIIVQAASHGGIPCPKSLLETKGCKGPAPLPCVLSPWTRWSGCDRTCGGGQSFRQRRVERPNEAGGLCAKHILRETIPCAAVPCAQEVYRKCEFAPWSAWSECSVDCGKGQESRKRSVQTPGSIDGEGCNGPLQELRGCERHECDQSDCRWSEWFEWSACSDSCGGGSKRRTRMVEVAPTASGKLCDPYSKAEVAPCNTQECLGRCVDGRWGMWMEWSECSATCSQGFKSRRREIEVQPNDCGRPSIGLTEQFDVCENAACMRDQDCEVSTWGEWSHCSCSCFGIRERNRFITKFASGNGQACRNTAIKVIEACNPGVTERTPEGCGLDQAVDCVLNPWQQWSACSASCGGGQKKRIRSIHIPPHFGGRPCHGALAYTAPCNVEACPDLSRHVCQDCIWGDWSDWGECSGCGGQKVRHRSIEQMANDCGTPCDMKSAKETTGCDAPGCETAYYCSWNDWSDSTGCASCGTSASMRNRAMRLSSVPTVDFLFKASHSHVQGCAGTQLNVTLCPQRDSCAPTCQPKHCQFGAWSVWAEPTWVGLCERHREIQSVNNECGDPCSGPILETKRCTQKRAPAAVDCVLSAWSLWSHCLTDARGQRVRSRHVVSNPKGDGQPCAGNLRETKPCVDPDPRDCQLTPWTEWGRCSQTCGKGGHQFRLRDVASQASGGGRQCDGSLEELQSCAEEVACPDGIRDCRMSKWTEWSLCDTDNQRYRSREVADLPVAGGASCDGALKETETCSMEVIDCEMSAWTPWSECDVTCGFGQSERQRQIQTFPERGGHACPNALIETRGCMKRKCADEKDCVVGQWENWGPCSSTCGVGQQSRRRPISNPASKGLGCAASLAETRHCHIADCIVQNCRWELWSQWSGCSCSCGGGTRTRSRDIAQEPRNGGRRCEQGDKEEVEACNTQRCGRRCRDGAWGAWTPWSACTTTCERGVSFRRRSVRVSADECGQAPLGKDLEVHFCNEDVSCEKDIDCVLSAWGTWSDCTATCGGVKRRARQVQVYGRGNGRYCQGALKETYPCNPGVDEEPPSGCSVGAPFQNCEFAEWSAWSTCSATCGGGQSHHSRGVAQFASGGGKGCSGALFEVKQCGEQACAGNAPVDCAFGEWEAWGACGKCSGERKRYRHILHHARNGGRNCGPTDTEQLGTCPITCAGEEHLYCTWQPWEHWSGCSRTCGRGTRVRRRYLHLTQNGLAMLPAPEVLLSEYEETLIRTRELEVKHVQELVLAFIAGCASLVSVFAVFKATSGRRGPEQHTDPAGPATAAAPRGGSVELPLLASEEGPDV